MAWRVAHLTLRFLLELVALGVVGYWGFQSNTPIWAQWLLGIGAPVVVAVAWGLWIAPRARVPLQPLMKEGLALLVFGSAALAWAATGHTIPALLFFGVAVVNSVVLYRAKDEPLPEVFRGG